MKWLLLAVAVTGCGAPFLPAYEGEPECGSSRVIHAVKGEACSGEIDIACDCRERERLRCEGGVWVYGATLCPESGLGAAN